MATLAKCNSKISELIYILRAETKALRAGNLRDVEAFAAEKNTMTAQLGALMKEYDKPESLRELIPQLKRLKKASAENGLMLKGVYNGMKAAYARVASIKSQSAQVGAYGRSGNNLYFHEEPAGNEKTL